MAGRGAVPRGLPGRRRDLVDAFDTFVLEVACGTGGTPNWTEVLLGLIRKNNNIFVGLWKVFTDSIADAPGPCLRSVPAKTTAKIMRWLEQEDRAHHFAGKTNKHKSGSGAKSVPAAMFRLL